MAKTFKVLSALLSYPTEELEEAAEDLRYALRDEALLPQATQTALDQLIAGFAARDLYDLQECYVELFDRGRSLSLYLFEHVHGESRDRGQAMIDLKALYEKHSLLTASSELPDFLPLFLEFLSILPVEEAREQLGQISHIASTLETRLRKRQAPYEVLFRALGDLAVAPPVAEEVRAPALEDEDPTDLAALDAQWEDAPVTFGPEAAPDCREQLFARIRAARRPAQNLEH
jgi:nitrate reductase molybdenum cofactor assembly chaperone NarJ/NarW